MSDFQVNESRLEEECDRCMEQEEKSTEEEKSSEEEESVEEEKSTEESPFGICSDDITMKTDKDGTNCPTGFFKSILDFFKMGN